jgi:hypothetical protein
MRHYGFTLLLAASALIISGVNSASAQTSQADSVRHRNNCRLARQVLVLGTPANKRGWALHYATLCGHSGGEALAAALHATRTGLNSGSEFGALLAASGALIDRAIVDTALALATDRHASTVTRINAILVLDRQVNPSERVSYDQITAASITESDYLVEGPDYGTEPPRDLELGIADALNEIAATASEPALRNAAKNASLRARSVVRVRNACPTGTPRHHCRVQF